MSALLSTSRQCYLRSVTDLHNKIKLPHNETVVIGRNETTGIIDPLVSRQQMEVRARIDMEHVMVKAIGQCYSGCNGMAMYKNDCYRLGNGDIIELRLGFHFLEIVFETICSDTNSDNRGPSPVVLSSIALSIDNADDNIKKPDDDDEMPAKKRLKVPSDDDGIGKWENIDGNDLLIYTCKNCTAKSSIAAFDLDGTLIKTRSGAVFPKDFDDWVFNFSEVRRQLKKLHDDNDYKIVIFTNQSRLSTHLQEIPKFKLKIECICKKLSLPVQVFIATGYTIYRKPAIGMWNILNDYHQDNIDITKSFYVGDAAGRKKNWLPKKKKDHSLADRLFALNVGLNFYTPEEYFLKTPPVQSYTMPEFDPKNLPILHPDPDININNQQEVILMVGSQGSGKTNYCKTQLIPKGYSYINRDELSTWQKCVRLLEEYLQKKLNVVIDNTNPDRETRQKYIDVCKKYRVNCRCFVMSTGFRHALHNNRFRQYTDKKHIMIKDMLLYAYKNKFQEPELNEGFTEIVRVPFVPKFVKPEHEQLYKLYLLEN